MPHLRWCRQLDEPCIPEVLAVVTGRTNTCAKKWQYIVLGARQEEEDSRGSEQQTTNNAKRNIEILSCGYRSPLTSVIYNVLSLP